MAKDKEPTREQAILLASKGLFPALYEVLFDYPHTMIIRTKDTKEPMIVSKD